MKGIRAEFNQKDLELFRKIAKFLDRCTTEQAAIIVNEALMIHPMMAWNPLTKHLDSIESVSINGESIQLNIKESFTE